VLRLVSVELRRAGETARAVSAKAPIAWRCDGPSACVKAKKKARRINDAPSNKTFGNCLLGFHCSQKRRAANRANARFLVVAVCQQDNSSTGYPQILVDVLGTAFHGARHCSDGSNRSRTRLDSNAAGEESPGVKKCEHTLTYTFTRRCRTGGTDPRRSARADSHVVERPDLQLGSRFTEPA
jgi:hypothetical protein